jgi:hypothetical protein
MRDMGKNDLNSAPRSRSAKLFTAPSSLHTCLPSSPVRRDKFLTLGEMNSPEFSSESHADADCSHYSHRLSNNDLSNGRYSIPFCPPSIVSCVSDQGHIFSMGLASSEYLTRAEETVTTEEIAREGEEGEARETLVRGREIYVATPLFGSPEMKNRQG